MTQQASYVPTWAEIERIARSAVRRARRQTPRKCEEEDLLQEARIAITRAASRYRPDNSRGASFATFAAMAAYGAVIDSFRRRRMSQYTDHETIDSRPLAAQEWLSALHSQQDLDRLLAKIYPTEAKVLRGIYIDGYSHEEIAQRMGVRRATVICYAWRGVRKLRAMVL